MFSFRRSERKRVVEAKQLQIQPVHTRIITGGGIVYAWWVPLFSFNSSFIQGLLTSSGDRRDGALMEIKKSMKRSTQEPNLFILRAMCNTFGCNSPAEDSIVRGFITKGPSAAVAGDTPGGDLHDNREKSSLRRLCFITRSLKNIFKKHKLVCNVSVAPL